MLRRVSTSFAAQVWALFLTLADRLILVGILLRVWGTDLYADWATLLAAAGLVSMGELGLNVYLGNAWQRAFAHKDEARFQRLLSISLSIYAVLTGALLILAAGFVLAGGLGGRLSLQVIEADTAQQVFVILAAAFALRVMRGSITQVYRGRGHYAAGTMINSLSTTAVIAGVVIAAYLGARPIHVALIYLVIEPVLGLGAVICDLKRRFPHLRFTPASPQKAELSDIAGHGKWYALLQAAPVAWLQIPVLMISALGLGGLAVVSFVVLRTLVNFTRQVPEMLARSVGVELAGDFHLGDRGRLSGIIAKFGPFLSALTGAFAGGLLIFSPAVVAIWTGKPETFNLWIIAWLLAPSILISPATPLRNILMLGNLPRPAAIAHAAQLAIGFPACFVLARTHGIEGAAAGLAIGETLAIGTLLPILARHHIATDYWRYLARCIAWFTATALWAAVAGWIILAIIGAATPVSAISSGLSWLVLGLAPAMIVATPSGIRQRFIR